eukprot:g4590.t1
MGNSQSTPDTVVAVIETVDREVFLYERQAARQDIENALNEIRQSLNGPITRRINRYHSRHGGAADPALHRALVQMRKHSKNGIKTTNKFIENFLDYHDDEKVLDLLSEERVHSKIMQRAETLKSACRNTTMRLEEILLAHSMDEYEAILHGRSVAVADDAQRYPGYTPCWALGSVLGTGGAIALGFGIHHIIVATASTVMGLALCIGAVVVLAVGAVALAKLAWAANEGEQKRRARETFQETESHLCEFWETGDHVLHDLQIFWNIWSEKHHHDVDNSPIENVVQCFLRQSTHFHDPGFLSANLKEQLAIVKDMSKSLAEREQAAQNYAGQCLALSNQFLTDLADQNSIPDYIIGDNAVKDQWLKMRKVLAVAPNNFGFKHAFLRFIDRSTFQGDFSMENLAESFRGNTDVESARGVSRVEADAARARLRLQINEAANVNISLRKFRNIDAIIENELLQKLPFPRMILNVLHEARRQLLIDIRSSNEDYHPDGDMEACILEYFALCVLCAGKEPAIIAKLADMFTIDGAEEEGIQLSQTMLERIRTEFNTDDSHMALRTQTQVFYAMCTMVCTNLREQATE